MEKPEKSGNPYRAEFLLKKLMEQMTDSIYFKDLNSRFVMVNKTLADAWGCSSPEELIGKSDFDSFQEEDARQMFEDDQSVIHTRNPIEGIEEETVWKDGHVAWSSTSKMPLIDDDGEVVGTFGISRNITDHKLAELKIERYAEEMRRIKEELEDDLRMAAELQKTFFPQAYPVFPAGASPDEQAVEFMHFFRASGTVSGDICTIRKLSDTECSILLCDVMGHGVRAALGTALIYASLDEFALQEKDPGGFLKRMNQRLYPVMRSEGLFLYATACYAVYNTETGELRMANAGHPVPLCFKAADKRVEWAMPEDARGPALAVSDAPEYSTVKCVLKPGDSVVLYTDGLYEVENEAGEEFGEERLLKAAGAIESFALKDILPSMIHHVQDFAMDDTFGDDLCMAGLSCTRPAD